MPFKNSEVRKQYLRDHYKANRARYLQRNRTHIAERRGVIRAEKTKPCADCRISYPPHVMDFDHLPGTKKLYAPNTLVTAAGMATLRAEIAKCEVVCANCHRHRTYLRGLRSKLGPNQ